MLLGEGLDVDAFERPVVGELRSGHVDMGHRGLRVYASAREQLALHGPSLRLVGVAGDDGLEVVGGLGRGLRLVPYLFLIVEFALGFTARLTSPLCARGMRVGSSGLCARPVR